MRIRDRSVHQARPGGLSSRAVPAWLLVGLVGGCGTEPSDAVDAVVEGDPPADTDSDETDPPDTLDPVVDPPSPPTTWGRGFVDLLAAAGELATFDVDAGDVRIFEPPQTTPAFLADVDGDGVPELILGRARATMEGAPTALVRAFRYDLASRQLQHDPLLSEVVLGGGDAPVGAFDLDGDGRADLIHMQQDPFLVRWGAGGGAFDGGFRVDVGIGSPSWFHGGITPWDLDGDGWLDLMLGSYMCAAGLVPVLRTGLRSWEPRLDLLSAGSPQVRTDVLVPMPAPNGLQRFALMGGYCDPLQPHPGFIEGEIEIGGLSPVSLVPPDPWWRFDPTLFQKEFMEIAPMGGAFTDLDGDGIFDVAISLGAQLNLIAQGTPEGTFVDRSLEAGVGQLQRDLYDKGFGWAFQPADLDRDGRTDLLLSVGDDVTSGLIAAGQVMRNQAWWNGGDWRFEEVSSPMGLTALGGYHGLVVDDLEGDGDPDLVIGGFGGPPAAWRNDIDLPSTPLALRLRGTTSNHLGIGAIVEIEADGLPLQRHMMGALGNPVGIGTPTLFVGLGEADRARVRVRWPSGLVQEWEEVMGWALAVLEEAPTLTLVPAGRHVPADGSATLMVELTPRDARGHLASGVAPVVALDGPGELLPISAGPDGVWRVAVRAPAHPGSTVLRVSMDGVPLGTSPRVWWDGAGARAR